MYPHQIHPLVMHAVLDAVRAHLEAEGATMTAETIAFDRRSGRLTVNLPGGTCFRVTTAVQAVAPACRARLRDLTTEYWLEGEELHSRPIGSDREGRPVQMSSTQIPVDDHDAYDLFSHHLAVRSYLMRIDQGHYKPLGMTHLAHSGVMYWLEGDDLVGCPIGMLGDLPITHACRASGAALTGLLADIAAVLRQRAA
ncbi:hypothetical protein ACFFMN_22925 [Planobispora siamensis]|uniref:Uncharacterized protein n=1 Tax=Planobispora siamensis TaxID=936338 RepID=A0A8J3SMR0_9ACTN|nr:hypothetical protein [Planobispora siamensis]GIH95421.1 hypothetical protein Psi01_60510 [Planobispora siamensis]